LVLLCRSSNFLKMLRLVSSIALRSAAERAEWLKARWRKSATAYPPALAFAFIINDSSCVRLDLRIQIGLSRKTATSFFTRLAMRCLVRWTRAAVIFRNRATLAAGHFLKT
jgi:hypothetical protein